MEDLKKREAAYKKTIKSLKAEGKKDLDVMRKQLAQIQSEHSQNMQKDEGEEEEEEVEVGDQTTALLASPLLESGVDKEKQAKK